MDSITKEEFKTMQLINNAKSVNDVASVLAHDVPTLADLDQEQLQHIAELVYRQRLANDLNKKVELSGIDYKKEKTIFVTTSGKNDSKHTQRAYQTAMAELETITHTLHINILELTPAQADDIICSVRGTKSPATIRRNIAVWSAFFTFMERRHANIKNPFRGTKKRPKAQSVKETIVPAKEEVEEFIANSTGIIKLAIAIMAYRGLRIGALPTLNITGNRFKAHSKGKDIAGELPNNVMKLLQSSGTSYKHLFVGLNEDAIRKKIERVSAKLFAERKINNKYSCHDFRHYYAVTLYQETKDIYRVSKALGHSNIAITQNYLRSIGQKD